MTNRVSKIVQSMIFRGAVKKVDDGKKVQSIQTSGLGGYVDDFEHVQPYGFRSRAFVGAQSIVARLGAVGALIGWVFDGRYKVTLAEGEVAIFDDQGQKVHLKRNGIEIAAKAGNTVDVSASGGVNVTGDTDVTGSVNSTSGYKFAGADGKTGFLTVSDTTAVGTIGTATIAIAGGIITNVTVTGTFIWLET